MEILDLHAEVQTGMTMSDSRIVKLITFISLVLKRILQDVISLLFIARQIIQMLLELGQQQVRIHSHHLVVLDLL